MHKLQYTIGRSERCDIVIDHAQVSRVHAIVEFRDNRYYLRDNDSSNGTYLNGHDRRVSEALLGQEDIVFLSRQYSVPARLLIEWLVDGHTSQGAQVESNAEVISIGRHPDNDVVLPSLRVAARQAELMQLPDGRRAVRDLDRNAMTYLNGHPVGNEPVVVNPGDALDIAGTQISLDYRPGEPGTRIAAIRQGVYMKAESVDWEVGSRSEPLRILESLDIAAFPGEVIGLLGPSGSGKTSLLDILCGARAPTRGSVRFDGLSLEQHRQQLLPLIGYVPQDDLLYAELTIREALYYYAKLRLPAGTEDSAIHLRIEELCEQLGLSERIDTLIGKPGNKTLSGGQRKRVSVALELLTDPLILFLDEPTSGLSSRDARVVMELLRKIARQSGVAVVVTIHQPSVRVYSLLDHAMYLKDGKLCYFGAAFPDSIRYFEPDTDPWVAGPDAIMERLEDSEATTLRDRFLHDTQASSQAWERLARAAHIDRDSPPQKSPKPSALAHGMLLLRRYARRLVRSHVDLAVMGSQALIIGGLLGFAFHEQYPLNTPVFLLSFVAIWLSTNNSAREIVSERTVFERERRGGIRSSGYFAAIVCGQFAIAVVQNAVILGLAITFAGLDVSYGHALAVCVTAGFVGIMVGLLISAVSRTEVAALVAVPLVLVPFILVAGMMIPYDNMPGAFKLLAQATPSKWAYESILAFEQVAFDATPPSEQRDAHEEARRTGALGGAISPFSSDYADASNDDLLRRGWIGVLILLAQGLFWGGLAYAYIRRQP